MDAHPRLKKAQSFLELALILPVLLIMLLGVVELSFMISQYLDLLDLTREAARFASVRDPFDDVGDDRDCSTEQKFDFFYDTACIFSPPSNAGKCNGDVTDPSHSPFCNGLNPYIEMDPATDDIVIRVFTVSDKDGYSVDNVWPDPTGDFGVFKKAEHAQNIGYWAWSNNDEGSDFSAPYNYADNWKYDCQGNEVRTDPYYTKETVNERLNTGGLANGMTTKKGFVSVELYYCYHHVLGLPIWTAIVSDPLRLHAYTIMALPAGAPTATPIP
jgi:hypothetical protein